MRSCSLPPLRVVTFTASCLLIINSRLGHPRRSLLLQPRRLRLLTWVDPRTVGNRPRRLPRRFQGPLRQFNLLTLTPLRVHASPPFSRAWLLPLCLIRDRHHLCPPSLRFVTVTTGAANALAKALPPFLVSCAMSRISMRAPSWTRPRAPCSQRLNGSPARLPLVVASSEWELGFACNRCGQASQARPPRVGDVIMGPLGASVSGEDTVMADAEVNVTPSLTVDLPPVVLQADFTERIRALPSNTILHVPASCRLRMISAVARCWNGMAQGRDDYARLEEERSKLLLSTVPQGLSVATEVLKCLTLWEEQSFETLLQRAEEQLLLERKSGKRQKTGGPPDPSVRGDRARRTAAVGAYRKATTGLVSSMLSFNEQEDVRWAQELLPTSTLGPSAYCDPHLAPPLAYTTRLSLLLVQLAPVPSTSPTCLTFRAGFMLTRSMQHCPPCSAGSPQVHCLLPPGGSHGHGFAGNARRTANRAPLRWVSSSAQPTPSAS